jgi:hypothetical protein
MNRGKTSRNKSGFKGVSWRKGRGKWVAQIGFMRRVVFLGYFDDPDEAHTVYASAVAMFHGAFGRE